MSTGLELQVIMPVVNAPFRIYYAYNPLRIDETVSSPTPITRGMFPAGAAGDYTYAQAVSIYQPGYLLREPRKTFRFTVATTF
jgi:outer membrane protein insertion porin family